MNADLIEKLNRNARFYENEAAAFKPAGARHLGSEEAATIAKLLREAIEAIPRG